ncbi:MAG: hypothetical protein WA919_14390 [Coleofasciculaceae cyanobacterium]
MKKVYSTKPRPNGQSPHLAHSEIPLVVFRPKTLRQSSIGFVEGVEPKLFLTSGRLGQVVVGAAGGQWLSSPFIRRETLTDPKSLKTL